MSTLYFWDAIAGEHRPVAMPMAGYPVSSARWERRTDQSIPTGAYTKIIPNYTDHNYDPDGLWTIDIFAGIITINRTGTYRVSAQVPWRSSATGHDAVAGILTGNGRTLARHNAWDEGGSFAQGSMLTTGNVRLVAGDTVFLEAYQNTGGNLTTYGDSQQGPFISIESVTGPVVLDSRYMQTLSSASQVEWRNSGFPFNSSQWTKVYFGDGDANLPTPWGSIFNYTCPRAGWYGFHAHVSFGGGGDRHILAVARTDATSPTAGNIQARWDGNIGNAYYITVAGFGYFYEGDPLNAYVWSNASSPSISHMYSRFSIVEAMRL